MEKASKPKTTTIDRAPSSEALPVESTRDQKQRRMVLKHGDRFLLLDLTGGMKAANGAGLGLYYNDTRYLSLWNWAINGTALQFLTADTREGFAASLIYSNAADGQLKEQQLFVERNIVLDKQQGSFLEEFTLTNYSGAPLQTSVALQFGSDYADMFEVRGDKRKARGHMFKPVLSKTATGLKITLAYLGLDNVVRETEIDLQCPAGFASPETAVNSKAKRTSANRAVTFRIDLPSQGQVTISARVQTREYANNSQRASLPASLDASQLIDVTAAHQAARLEYRTWRDNQASISTGSSEFNAVLEQAYRDLYLLRQTSNGLPAMAAGVPWFAVPFGRDSLVVGLQTLNLMPVMSREVIEVLAHYQGTKHEVETAEMPGRIMHELRPGEMARLGEIAFRPYYGTVDATPLWLWLFAEYVLLTGNMAFARKYWKNARAALDFLAGEVTASGYLTYGGRGDTALSNQGWKDSGNCIVYSNGELARGPIAVCEAQGYLYAAWSKLAKVAKRLGYRSMARSLTLDAIALKQRFNRQFYMADKRFYAIALDGANKRCDVISSNPGHLIITGILPHQRALEVADRMLADDMFTGFGVRTLSSSEAAYQPMDYQVGAVWPHDNGFLVAGLCQLGKAESAHKVLRALTEVALSQADRRLPELFCGFTRGNAQMPVPYPVACIPQLWAAGSVFHMTQSLLQMSLAAGSSSKWQNAVVPAWLGHIEVKGMHRANLTPIDLKLETCQ